MLREIIVFAVFKDKDTILFQQLLFDNQVWNLWQLLQRIGRISKDKVILLLARLNKAEDIATDGDDRG